MVPTIVPDNVDYMAIAMVEKTRIRGKMPSAILNVPGTRVTRLGSTGDHDASSSSSNAQVSSFRFSAVRKTCSHMNSYDSYLHTEKLGHFNMVFNSTQVDIIFTYAIQGDIERIRALIESGQASASDRNDDGITLLHVAAITGRVPVCAYLIEKGAEVNALGGSLPATPLQWAARKGLVEIMDLLIQHGANPRLVDSRDFSCLHSVTHSSDSWALLYILCQPDIAVDERDNIGLTPLHWAAQQGHQVSVEVLLKFGANPNVVDLNGLTALHWAASRGNRGCISQLLEAGADVRAMNRDHRKAQEMADRYNKRGAWDAAVEEVGFKADGTRVRRPLSEVCGRPCASSESKTLICP
jgi:ankyrin repeat protein